MLTSEISLDLTNEPAQEDVEFLDGQINAFNMAAVGSYDAQLLAAFARHPERGIVAGVSGYTWARFCEIQLLWVHSDLRSQGYGSRLLGMAEDEARARGCGLITLGSYTFQAPGFYQRHGYQVVGTVPDCPPGHAHVYLMKVL
jgi:GNAT superfamily N-acetyltransferase